MGNCICHHLIHLILSLHFLPGRRARLIKSLIRDEYLMKLMTTRCPSRAVCEMRHVSAIDRQTDRQTNKSRESRVSGLFVCRLLEPNCGIWCWGKSDQSDMSSSPVWYIYRWGMYLVCYKSVGYKSSTVISRVSVVSSNRWVACWLVQQQIVQTDASITSNSSLK